MESKSVDKIIKLAVANAEELEHEYMTVEHLTVSLLDNARVADIIKELQVDGNQIKTDLVNYLQDSDYNGLKSSNGLKGSPKKTAAVDRIIQRALAQVIFNGRDEIQPLDLFISILSEDETPAKYYCEMNGLDRNMIVDFIDKKYRTAKSAELIEEYTTNLNVEAQKNKIDPLIGREQEVDDLVHILARRKKNNVVLLVNQVLVKLLLQKVLQKELLTSKFLLCCVTKLYTV